MDDSGKELRRTPDMANYAHAVVAGIYAFAQRRGYVAEGADPAARIEKYAERRRRRFLTSEELSRIGDALRDFAGVEPKADIA